MSARVFSPIRKLFQSVSLRFLRLLFHVFVSVLELCSDVSRKQQVRSAFSADEDPMVPVGSCLAARVPVRGLQVPVQPPCYSATNYSYGPQAGCSLARPRPRPPTDVHDGASVATRSPLVHPSGRPRARHQCCELQLCRAAGYRRNGPSGQAVGHQLRYVPHARPPQAPPPHR